jgi:hypothetical protein
MSDATAVAPQADAKSAATAPAAPAAPAATASDIPEEDFTKPIDIASNNTAGYNDAYLINYGNGSMGKAAASKFIIGQFSVIINDLSGGEPTKFSAVTIPNYYPYFEEPKNIEVRTAAYAIIIFAFQCYNAYGDPKTPYNFENKKKEFLNTGSNEAILKKYNIELFDIMSPQTYEGEIKVIEVSSIYSNSITPASSTPTEITVNSKPYKELYNRIITPLTGWFTDQKKKDAKDNQYIDILSQYVLLKSVQNIPPKAANDTTPTDVNLHSAHKTMMTWVSGYKLDDIIARIRDFAKTLTKYQEDNFNKFSDVIPHTPLPTFNTKLNTNTLPLKSLNTTDDAVYDDAVLGRLIVYFRLIAINILEHKSKVEAEYTSLVKGIRIQSQTTGVGRSRKEVPQINAVTDYETKYGMIQGGRRTKKRGGKYTNTNVADIRSVLDQKVTIPPKVDEAINTITKYSNTYILNKVLLFIHARPAVEYLDGLTRSKRFLGRSIEKDNILEKYNKYCAELEKIIEAQGAAEEDMSVFNKLEGYLKIITDHKSENGGLDHTNAGIKAAVNNTLETIDQYVLADINIDAGKDASTFIPGMAVSKMPANLVEKYKHILEYEAQDKAYTALNLVNSAPAEPYTGPEGKTFKERIYQPNRTWRQYVGESAKSIFNAPGQIRIKFSKDPNAAVPAHVDVPADTAPPKKRRGGKRTRKSNRGGRRHTRK